MRVSLVRRGSASGRGATCMHGAHLRWRPRHPNSTMLGAHAPLGHPPRPLMPRWLVLTGRCAASSRIAHRLHRVNWHFQLGEWQQAGPHRPHPSSANPKWPPPGAPRSSWRWCARLQCMRGPNSLARRMGTASTRPSTRSRRCSTPRAPWWRATTPRRTHSTPRRAAGADSHRRPPPAAACAKSPRSSSKAALRPGPATLPSLAWTSPVCAAARGGQPRPFRATHSCMQVSEQRCERPSRASRVPCPAPVPQITSARNFTVKYFPTYKARATLLLLDSADALLAIEADAALNQPQASLRLPHTAPPPPRRPPPSSFSCHPPPAPNPPHPLSPPNRW